ncbi:MAG: hypothetical protein Q9221_006843 [Calogaya cf. arnoldii]
MQPRELSDEFRVTCEPVHPRSKPKADALSVRGSGEDPSSKKRPGQAQNLRRVRRCTSSIRKSTISCPPLNRLSNQDSLPPPYASPTKVENERRGRSTGRDARRAAPVHHHERVPEITVEDYSERAIEPYHGSPIIDGTLDGEWSYHHQRWV